MSLILPDDYVMPATASPQTSPTSPIAQPLPNTLAAVMAQLQAAASPSSVSASASAGQNSPLTRPAVEFITQDSATRMTLAKAYRLAAAPRENPILILGPSGTGKELLAQIIHGGAPSPFVAVNISAITETLLHSTLFGHVKGSFTGAIADFPGLFCAAGSGTIFLDEIGDMPLPQQSALLRAISAREVTPVGTTLPRRIHCRIIAATNVDTADPALFRNDLAARFMYTLRLSALLDRPDDIPLIMKHYNCTTRPDETALRRFNVRAILQQAAEDQLATL